MVQMPPGVSQRDLAVKLGVSVSTISRALSDNARVSTLTKQAVRQAITELSNGQRNDNGHVRTRTMIGLTQSHLSNGPAVHSLDTILEQVLGGIELACARADYIPYPWQQSRLLTNDAGAPFFESVSGVVVSGGLVERSVIDAILAQDIPLVIIGGHVPDLPVPSVAADSYHGMYLATRHLLDLGHRRIGFVNGPPETYTSGEKLSGHLTALAEAGIGSDPALIRAGSGYGGFDEPLTEALTVQLLDLPERPTAIMFAADQMATGAYRICQRYGLRVPDDISIVGFHDDKSARYAHPPITTVRVDRTQWGEVATDALIRIVNGEPSRNSRLLLPVELIVRASTGPPLKQT